VKVGDLVQTVKGWSYKTWTGVIIKMNESELPEDWAQVLWTEASGIDDQVFWVPVNKCEVISESR
jgi:hypothetical protein